MNNKLSGTISVADLGNQLKLLADKGPITKEGLSQGALSSDISRALFMNSFCFFNFTSHRDRQYLYT